MADLRGQQHPGKQWKKENTVEEEQKDLDWQPPQIVIPEDVILYPEFGPGNDEIHKYNTLQRTDANPPHTYSSQIPGKNKLWLISEASLGYGQEKLLIQILRHEDDFNARDITDSFAKHDFKPTEKYLDTTVTEAVKNGITSLGSLERSMELTPEKYDENVLALQHAAYEVEVYLAIIKGLELKNELTDALKRLNSFLIDYYKKFAKVETKILVDTWEGQ